MRIIDLQTFVALARARHFGKTAEKLNTTQPAISMRLANLEREMGVQLVRRDERSFELTTQGRLALEGFQRLLHDFDALRIDLTREAPAPSLMRIGAIDSISSTILPHLVESLRGQHPLLKIDLTVDSTIGLIARLREGQIDISFSLDPVLDEGFRSYVGCTFEMSWIGSSRLIEPERLHSVDELAELPIITFPQDTPPFRMIAPYFHDENRLAAQLTSSNSLYAMINLVIDGFGIAPIPTVVVRRELKSNLLHRIRVTKPFPPMPIVVSYRSSPRLPLMDAVVGQARDSARHFCAHVNPEMAWIGN